MARFCALVLLLCAALPTAAWADDNRPLLITVSETGATSYDVSWKIPPNLSAAVVPQITPPTGCGQSAPRSWSDATGFRAAAHWQCKRALAGTAIAIRYPNGGPPLATILRLRGQDGSEQTLLGQPGETRIKIPQVPAEGNLFLKFFRLGIVHIWTGFDHLLFVACLIFVAGTIRRTAVTITGFTISHSITLALASLGLVTFPPGAVEAVIALSIVFLAVEIAKGPRATLTWRQPVFVAASFGLLHGFGFAAVLAEVGLPRENLALALLAFNLGIEFGQIAFASVIFTLLYLLARLPAIGHPQRLQRIAGYSVGILASYWLFNRLG